MKLGELSLLLDFSCNVVLVQEVASIFGRQVVRENVNVEDLNLYANCKVFNISHGHYLEITIGE